MRSKKNFLIVAGFLGAAVALFGTAPASAQSISVGGTFAGPHGVVSFHSGNGGYYGGGDQSCYYPARHYVRPYVRPYVLDDCDDDYSYDDAFYTRPVVTYRTPRYVSYGYSQSYGYGRYSRYRSYPRSYGRYSGHRYDRGGSYRR